MIKYQDAVESAKLIIQYRNLTADAIMLAKKADWSVHVIGTYDLIFPHLHIDFPTREEVLQAIQKTMDIHHATIKHYGKYSHTGGKTKAAPAPNIRCEIKGGPEFVRGRGSVVNAIGYGVGSDVPEEEVTDANG